MGGSRSSLASNHDLLSGNHLAAGLILGLAAARLVLRCRNVHRIGWDYDRLWVSEARLDLCLASLAVLFLTLYFAFIGIPGKENYAASTASARLPRGDVVLGYTRVDLLPWLLVA